MALKMDKPSCFQSQTRKFITGCHLQSSQSQFTFRKLSPTLHSVFPQKVCHLRIGVSFLQHPTKAGTMAGKLSLIREVEAVLKASKLAKMPITETS